MDIYLVIFDAKSYELTGKLYDVNACRTHGSALKPSDHSCKSDHYSYTTITYNIPVSALNHEIKVRIEGRYWRWGSSYKDQPVDVTKSIKLDYTYSLGALTISKSASNISNGIDPGFAIDKKKNLTFYWKVAKGGNMNEHAKLNCEYKLEKENGITKTLDITQSQC